MEFHRPAVRHHACEVRRGLHQPGHGHRHPLHPVGAGRNGLDQISGNLLRQHFSRFSDLRDLDRHRVLDAGVLGPYGLLVGFHRGGELVVVPGFDQHHGLGLARDGVAESAAVHRRQQHVARRGIQKAEQHLVGVGALADDLDARVTALEPLDADLRSGITARGRRLGLVAEGHIGVEPSGAAHVEFALLLGIEVQQDVAVQQPLFQTVRTVHAGLLGGREQGLQRPVLQRPVLQHREDRRHADTVVGAQRRAVGRHPAAVDVGVDGVLGEIELLVVVLLRNHVEVGLQDHALAVLHPLRGGFADIDVVRRVLLRFEALRAGEIENIAADLLLVRRGARDADDLREMFPDKRRFQRDQITVHNIEV